jgi:pimeloyl-ACP methyl ester carboxylesterase
MASLEYAFIDGIKIAYRSEGDGTPLVLLHGFTYSSYSFRYNIPILSKHARVVCPDLIGHGLSDKPLSFDYSLKSQAELLVKFCSALGLKRITLGGCSMGGALAMQAAIAYPELISRVILVDSAGVDLDVRSPQLIFAIPIVGHLAALGVTMRFRKSTYRRMMSGDCEIALEREKYIRELNKCSTLLAGVRNLRANRAFKLEGIERIRQETLIIWGERDPLFSVETARGIATSIPASRLVVLPDAGHLPNEEKPADFNQVVVDFILGRIPSAKAGE